MRMFFCYFTIYHIQKSDISLLSLHSGFFCGKFLLDIIEAQLEAVSTDLVPIETAAATEERVTHRRVLVDAVFPLCCTVPKVGRPGPAPVPFDATGRRGIDLGRAERPLQALCLFVPFDARGDLNDSVLRLEHLSQRDKLVLTGSGVARRDLLVCHEFAKQKVHRSVNDSLESDVGLLWVGAD